MYLNLLIESFFNCKFSPCKLPRCDFHHCNVFPTLDPKFLATLSSETCSTLVLNTVSFPLYFPIVFFHCKISHCKLPHCAFYNCNVFSNEGYQIPRNPKFGDLLHTSAEHNKVPTAIFPIIFFPFRHWSNFSNHELRNGANLLWLYRDDLHFCVARVLVHCHEGVNFRK